MNRILKWLGILLALVLCAAESSSAGAQVMAFNGSTSKVYDISRWPNIERSRSYPLTLSRCVQAPRIFGGGGPERAVLLHDPRLIPILSGCPSMLSCGFVTDIGPVAR